VLTFTDRATDAIALFHQAAARWNPQVQIRLVPEDDGLKPQLADRPEDEDVPIHVGSVTVFVPQGLDGVVDAGDHNELSLSRA
jgi:hypothetical protein